MQFNKVNLVWIVFFILLFLATSKSVYADNNYDIKSIDSLENALLLEKVDSIKADILISLAAAYSRNNINLAFAKIAEANNIVFNSGIVNLKPRLFYTYANIYLNHANYQKALFYYLQALRLFEKNHNFESIARSLNNIGVVYSYLKKLAISEKYFRQSLLVREQNGLMSNVGILYTSIGYIHTEKKEYKEAQNYFIRALEIGKKNNNKYLMAFSYSDIGLNYKNFNLLNLSKKYIDSAIIFFSTIDDFHNLSINYNYLSEVAIKEKQLKKAEKYLLTSREFAIKSGIKIAILENYRQLSELYKLQNRFEDAYNVRIDYERLKDSTLNDKTYSQITSLQNEYEIEKKNNEILLLNKDKDLSNSYAQKQILVRNILIIFTCFVLFFLFVLWRNIKLKKQLNRKLIKENIYLHNENIQAQYDVLIAKFDPHFLFNSLSTLSSLIETNKDNAILFIEHFSLLYRNILSVGDIKLLDLKEEMNITESYIYLQTVRFGNKLNFEVDLSNTKNKKLPAFAIQMVVENAIKHNIISKSKPLKISIFTNGNDLIIENILQPKIIETLSLGIGQKNILDRYRLLSDKIPSFSIHENCYRVVLPLI